MSSTELKPQLGGTRLRQAEQVYNCWAVEVEHTITRDDLKRPAFWAHVAARLRPGDEVRVRSEDDTFIARYVVLSSDKTWAQVHELYFVDLATESLSADILEDYEVKHRGRLRWSVIRKQDQTVLIENLHTKDAANDWLKQHLNIGKAA